MATPWFMGKVTQSCSNQYYCDGSVEGGAEGGVDISTPLGSPVTSVTAGKVVGVGPVVFAGGKLGIGQVVTVRGAVPYFHNQVMDVYYQHLINTNVKKGDSVQVGDTLGHTNTWIEFGLNPPWSGPWASPHPNGAKWINPVKSGYLKSIQTAGFGTKSGAPPAGAPPAGSCNPSAPWLTPAACISNGWTQTQIDAAQASSPWGWLQQNVVSYGEHIAIFVLALMMIILGFVLVGFAPAQKLASGAAKAALLA